MRTALWISLLVFAGSVSQAVVRMPATEAQKMTAILSVKKGASLSAADLKAVFKNPEVKSHRDVFMPAEKAVLKKLHASYLDKAWVLELRGTSSFDVLEREIRRGGLPVNLDWNEMEVKVQSDALENLQWALKNTGVPQSVDLDPMQAYQIAARAGEDIHLPAPVRGKKILVAVLDTGVDHEHADLKAVLHHNDSECAALKKFQACITEKDRATCEKTWMNPKNPEVDKDHNGYPMDCSGWSLLGGVNSAGIMGRPDFDDDQGHGTHVAGLVGAARNGVGTVGVSSNVEILPVQVLGEQPSEPMKPLSVDLSPNEASRAGMNQSLGDMVARGVIYAINSGAKVINFSMGWPQSRDSEFMRAVIEEAQSRGIIIVAAAGNDSTRALLRPCAYPGVICVGATGPDGAPAHFSNHGVGVDINAPGVNILSTYPMSKRPVRYRQALGYEYLSGTSQASPIVAGAVAELLARGIPSSEVYARLVLSSRPVQKNLPLLKGLPHEVGAPMPEDPQVYRKMSVGGNLDLAAALSQTPQPLIVPASKEKSEIVWDRRSRRLSLEIPLKNLWQNVSSDAVKVTAFFARPDREAIRPTLVSIVPVEAAKEVWSAGEVRTYRATFSIDDTTDPGDTRIPSELDLGVDVVVKGTNAHRFMLSTEITVPVTADMQGPDVETFTLAGMPKGRTTFVPIDENFDDQPQRRDYLAYIEQGSSRQMWLVSQGSSSASAPFVVKGGTKIRVSGDSEKIREQISVRVDLENDGHVEYVLGLLEDRSEDAQPGPSPITFYTFDSEMRLREQMTYESKLAQIPYSVSWMMSGGKKRPSWVGSGKDPAKKVSLADRWTNPTGAEKNEVRFYWLDSKAALHAIQEYKGYKIVDLLEPHVSQKKADACRCSSRKTRARNLIRRTFTNSRSAKCSKDASKTSAK